MILWTVFCGLQAALLQIFNLRAIASVPQDARRLLAFFLPSAAAALVSLACSFLGRSRQAD